MDIHHLPLIPQKLLLDNSPQHQRTLHHVATCPLFNSDAKHTLLTHASVRDWG
jgi:hypothetical protein